MPLGCPLGTGDDYLRDPKLEPFIHSSTFLCFYPRMEQEHLEFLSHFELAFDPVRRFILCQRCAEKPLVPSGLAKHIRKTHGLEVERQDSRRLTKICHNLPRPPLQLLRQRPTNRESTKSVWQEETHSWQLLEDDGQVDPNMERTRQEGAGRKRRATDLTDRPANRKRIGDIESPDQHQQQQQNQQQKQQQQQIQQPFSALDCMGQLMSSREVSAGVIKSLLSRLVGKSSDRNVYVFEPSSMETLEAIIMDNPLASTQPYDYLIFPICERGHWYVAVYRRENKAVYVFASCGCDHIVAEYTIRECLSSTQYRCITLVQDARKPAICKRKEDSGIFMLGSIMDFLKAPEVECDSMSAGKIMASRNCDARSLRISIAKEIDPIWNKMCKSSLLYCQKHNLY